MESIIDEMLNQNSVRVPKDVLVGLYRIACGVSNSLSGYEVCDEAKPGMEKSLDWILKYGKDNNIESRGFEEHKAKQK